MCSLLQTVITADELMETSDVSNQVSAASVVQQNAATLFYCEAPEQICGRRHFTWLYELFIVIQCATSEHRTKFCFQVTQLTVIVWLHNLTLLKPNLHLHSCKVLKPLDTLWPSCRRSDSRTVCSVSFSVNQVEIIKCLLLHNTTLTGFKLTMLQLFLIVRDLFSVSRWTCGRGVTVRFFFRPCGDSGHEQFHCVETSWRQTSSEEIIKPSQTLSRCHSAERLSVRTCSVRLTGRLWVEVEIKDVLRLAVKTGPGLSRVWTGVRLFTGICNFGNSDKCHDQSRDQ